MHIQSCNISCPAALHVLQVITLAYLLPLAIPVAASEELGLPLAFKPHVLVSRSSISLRDAHRLVHERSSSLTSVTEGNRSLITPRIFRDNVNT